MEEETRLVVHDIYFTSWFFIPYFVFLNSILQVVRLACYSLKLYGCLRGDKGWQKAGSQLSHARMLLRLFDDLPTLMGTLSYGLGKHVSVFIYFLMISSILTTKIIM